VDFRSGAGALEHVRADELAHLHGVDALAAAETLLALMAPEALSPRIGSRGRG
jgi:hypothetical protein